MTTEKTYRGLVIKSHCVLDAESKAQAISSLTDWRSVTGTAEKWVSQLEKGHTIQPSQFSPTSDGSYSHAKTYWQGTHFVCADADHIKGVEFNEVTGEDVNPAGVDAWQKDKHLSKLYPSLKDDCYAVIQSVSSMSDDKPPPHRRYRLIFLFDEMITSTDHYSQILLTLAEKYPIIPAVERSPAQPVFGNARPETGKAYITGNVLSLSAFPFVQPTPSEKPSGKGNTQAGIYNATQRKYQHELEGLIADAKLTRYDSPRGDGTVRVDCPFNSDHNRDAFVGLDADGYPYFKCHHNSCNGNGFNEMVKLAGIEVVSDRKTNVHGTVDAEDLDLSPLPVAHETLAPAFPNTDGELFLGGMQALYQAYANTHVWSPEMLLAMGIGAYSFIGKNVKVRTHEQANAMALNSFILAVGESDLTAKSEALSEIKKFMYAVDHDFAPISNVQSIEGLLTALNDGESPERYCLFDEGSVVFENTRRQGTKNLFAGLNELWLCPPTYATARAAGVSKVVNPYVCAWANIPTKLIASVFRHEDMIGGSLNRWLPFFISPKTKTERYPHAEGHPYDVFIKELYRVADVSRARVMTFTEEADDSRFAWFEQLRGKAIESGEQIGESRFHTHAVKLASIFALAENDSMDDSVKLHQWDAALSVVRYLSDCADYLFRNVGATRIGELENELLDVLAQHDNEMPLNVLTRKTQRFDREERAKLLDLLEDSKLIVRYTERTKGRPKVMVRRVS